MYILPVSLFNFGIAAVDNLLIIEYMSISSHTHCVSVAFFSSKFISCNFLPTKFQEAEPGMKIC